MAESERYMPEFLDRVEALMHEAGVGDEDIHVRISGCPNGCSRPYLGEIALVGRAPGRYNLYLGASHDGTRLNALHLDNADESAILEALRGIFQRFASGREPGERFGDFTVRAGIVPAMLHGRDFQRAPAAGRAA
jgi:sulfite reductase (NADPH) hemoprotein beta-component